MVEAEPVNTDPKHLSILERRRQAMELRIQRHSFRKITEIMKEQGMVPPTYSISTCHGDVKQSIHDLILSYTETAEELLAMNVETINRIVQTFLPYAIRDGDMDAANLVMRGVDQLVRLTGLDAYLVKKHHMDEVTVNYRMLWPEQAMEQERGGDASDVTSILRRAVGYTGDNPADAPSEAA